MPTDTKLYGKKRKKRRFSGNQFRNKKKNVLDSSPHEESDHTDTDSEKENIGAKPDRLFESVTPTRSEKKLFNIYNLPSDSSDSEKDTDFEPSDSEEEGEEDGDVVTDEVLEGYRLIDVDILAKNISTQLSCKSCGQDVTLLELSRKGLASEFVFHCVNKRCDNQTPFPSSPIIQVGNLKVSSVNRRACFAMRCTGGGRAELQTFCGVMALPPPVLKSSNHIIQKTVMKAATAVQDTSMRKAAEAEYALAEVTDTGIRDIDASLDGTYMTRGHTSLIGVTTAIGCVTGKVLDTGVLSKICKSCEYWSKQDHTTERYRRWQANHPAKCTKTHDGSSGSMESKIACDIFGRSIDRYKLRYTRYIGDGDTNSFKTVAQSRPYGDTQIVKIECVGHVQKRMGTRLRNLKNSMKGRRLSDGKTIGGKGRLTDDQMGKFQQYYGNAIRENKGNIKRMREAVWAVYFHKRSCDENPIHNFCNISWCPYLKAQAANQPYSHKNNLPVPIMDIVKPIFKDLANTDLLRKCLDGYTQNANESVNSVIWKYCSKTRFHGLTVVQTAVAIAVCLFNDGASTVKTMLEKMGITVFTFTRQFLEDKDALRIICAQRQARMSSKEYRRAQRLRRLGREEELAQLEGFPYQAGGY